MNRQKRTHLIILFIATLLASQASSQEIKTTEKPISNKILNFQFHYTYAFTGGELAQRFGPIHNIGFGGLLKTTHNWLIGIDGSYQFGSNVDENISSRILSNISNSSGAVSNNAGNSSVLSIGERGLNFFVKGGKVIPIFLTSNLNSGIVIMAGGGFVSHMVNISTSANVPTLTDDLKRGYDRLTMGWAANQFVGYYFQGKNRFINFYVGVDVIEAFTKSVRGYNYDERAFDNASRTDIFYGPRFGWMIPIYLNTKEQEEFFYK